MAQSFSAANLLLAMSMSAANNSKQDALDYCNTHLDIDAASVLLRLSVKAGQRPNLKRLDPVEPPRVPPPTRASSPSPDSDSDFAIHQLKWLAPLTPVDYESPESSPLSSPDTDAADSDGDVHYFFLPPVTPLDFKHGTSELWRSLDNDPADSDSATATGSGAEYSACHARARRQPRQSIRNTLDDCDGPSEGDRPKEECAAKAEDDSV